MESMMNLITDNSEIFVAVTVVIVLAVIGFIGEKARNKNNEEKPRVKKPKVEKVVPVKEEVKEEEVQEESVEPKEDMLTNDPVYGVNSNDDAFDFSLFGANAEGEEEAVSEESVDVSEEPVVAEDSENTEEEPKEDVNEDLFAPIGDINPTPIEEPEAIVAPDLETEPKVEEAQIEEPVMPQDLELPNLELPKAEAADLELPKAEEVNSEEPSFQFFAPTENAEEEKGDRF